MSKASGSAPFNRLRTRWLFCCRNANESHQIHFRVFLRRWPLIDARRSNRSKSIDAECGMRNADVCQLAPWEYDF